METYCKARPFVDNPGFEEQRDAALAALADAEIDEPIVQVIADLNRLPYCFTLQCCHGHFVIPGEGGEVIESVPPAVGRAEVTYRLAYVAFALRNDDDGRAFLEVLKELRDLEPRYLQVGSAGWFWDQQVNSYVIQAGPKRQRKQDSMVLDGKAARHVSHTRARMFRRLGRVALGDLTWDD